MSILSFGGVLLLTAVALLMSFYTFQDETTVAVETRAMELNASFGGDANALDTTQATALSLQNRDCPEGKIHFYGECYSQLQVFGQEDFTQAGVNTVDAFGISHASGIAIDRSIKPNRLWVVDAGNNRVLGYSSLGTCSATKAACTNNSDCSTGETCAVQKNKEPDIVLGQPNFNMNACNGDVNVGVYADASSTSLCLFPYPDGTNTGEYWMRINTSVDTDGNLYVPDLHNNRILRYNDPLCTTGCVSGAGDKIADHVWGQDSFAGHIPNGAGPAGMSNADLSLSGRTIRESDGNTHVSFEHVSSRSVSIDKWGNMWVADTFNNRVLRFPNSCSNGECLPAQTADLVIGQTSFTASSSYCHYTNEDVSRYVEKTDMLCNPIIAQVHPETGKLYVVDERPGGFKQRVLIYTPTSINDATGPDFNNGQAGEPLNLLSNYFTSPPNTTFQTTGLTFNTEELWNGPIPEQFAQGDVWFSEHVMHRVSLVDVDVHPLDPLFKDKQIVGLVGAFGKDQRGRDYSEHAFCGMTNPSESYNVAFPGGSVQFDDGGNMYVGDEYQSQISIYDMKNFRYTMKATNEKLNFCHSQASAGLFNSWENSLTDTGIAPLIGVSVFDDQLIVKDWGRYLVWNNYLSQPNNAAADIVYGGADPETGSLEPPWLGDRTFHTIDNKNRLWHVNNQRTISVTQLPITHASQPEGHFLKLVWDTPECRANSTATGCTVEYNAIGFAYDSKLDVMWVSDPFRHRLYGLTEFDDLSSPVYVTYLLGQKDRTGTACNFDQTMSWLADGPPTAKSLCAPNYITFDNYNNLYIVENTYECHGNDRIVVYTAEDLAQATQQAQAAGDISLFKFAEAKKVFNQKSFTTQAEKKNCAYNRSDTAASPIAVAFNSRNEMIVSNDGYYPNTVERPFRQLWWYHNPLLKQNGEYVQDQMPDGYLKVPMGAGGDMTFDDNNNLTIRDHTWSRVWVINFDSDPQWLVVTNPNPFPTVPAPSPTPAWMRSDFIKDGKINIFDFQQLILHFNETNTDIPEDLNEDGMVNVLDFSLFIQDFGKPDPTPTQY